MKFKRRVVGLSLTLLAFLTYSTWFKSAGKSQNKSLDLDENIIESQRENHIPDPQPKFGVDESETSKKKPLVILLTYQRCGSSFLGFLFDKNPDGFYVYEPLDAVYSAMYGTAEGWNVPSDITHTRDGHTRVLPADEIQAVSRFQKYLLNCQFERLPTEFFAHKYWLIFKGFQSGLADFRDCLLETRPRVKCSKILKDHCPHRFGEDLEKQKHCHDNLWLKDATTNSTGAFLKYNQCLRKLNLDKCVGNLQMFCEKSALRAIKTVRGTMDSVLPLLRELPELKLISLVRDPRAVALSRMKLHSSRGIYSQDNVTKEAELYCGTVTRDYDVMRGIPSHRILKVIYDEFVLDPLAHTEEIYRFIGSDLPNVTRDFMEKNTRQTSRRWETKLQKSDVSGINKVCKDFFATVKWDWVNVET